ncbi:HEPN/Toprim-associated domain-containing protein [Streptomyces sp. SudanB52_2052]|uniref:HEPN/Toprim-associated domain-containing protein n=1 Tax=Streptomyces sp. SudanB52_2052 TaxID=3035276 RepID=UPI003F56C181
MGHYSYLVVGDCRFLYTRSGYDPELAALFDEADRQYVVAGEESGDGKFGYFTTAYALRQRLEVQGFTSRRAQADLEKGLRRWRERYDGEHDLRRKQQSAEDNWVAEHLTRTPREAADLLANIGRAIRPHRPIEEFNNLGEFFRYEQQFVETCQDLDELRGEADRSLIRVILDQAPDETVVGLDLSELTGCCVHLDPAQPIAGATRMRQLASLPAEAPLIVLTEGSSDSRLLTDAMQITHPHLVQFVRFIDYAGSDAQGSAGALALMVSAFIAAGVANRFVAIADNDASAHVALAKLKNSKLPAGCQVLHYPNLPLLASYPTIGPSTSTAIPTDVNGVAGSLEMYLGKDVLTIDGSLAPVHLSNYEPKVQRHHGALSKQHKRLVQKAFRKKIKAAQQGEQSSNLDWSGVHAIVESIVHAFD